MDLYLERDVSLRRMVVILEKLDIVHLRQEKYEKEGGRERRKEEKDYRLGHSTRFLRRKV